MIGTVSAIVIAGGISAWALWLIIRAQRTEHHQRRAKRMYNRLATQHRNDVAHAASGRCACCQGELTALRYDAETKLNICADRELCRLTMIHENLLDQV
jgi:ABC-type nickel/cobalt efflux system permease component RcnA